jgi:hypothetical protein
MLKYFAVALVRHAGHRELVAETQNLTLPSFEQVIAGFTSKSGQRSYDRASTDFVD